MSHRSRTWAHFALIVAALLSLSVVSAQDQPKPEAVGLRPDAPPYALHGPYWVGTREFVVEPDSERPLPVMVWYPALNPDGLPQTHTYTVDYGTSDVITTSVGAALLDAKPDPSGQPYPLVVYSPSLWTSPIQFVFLTEHLASWGFVVMTVDHPGSGFAAIAAGWIFDHAIAVQNPLDNQRVMDFAAAISGSGGELEGLIDTDHIAVVGGATGGTDALVAAGALFDLSTFKDWCSQHPTGEVRDFPSFCLLRQPDKQRELAALVGLDAPPDGQWPSLGDARVRAIVAFSPSQPMMFGPSGLQAVTVPALVIYGTSETLWPPEFNAVLAYENLGSSQKSLVAFEAADSWIWFDTCQVFPDVTAGDFFWCSDPVWDMDRAHDLINHFTTAFLLDTLKGKTSAHFALAPYQVNFRSITYTAEGF